MTRSRLPAPHPRRLLPPLVGFVVVGAVLASGMAWVTGARASEPAPPFLWKVEREGQPAAWLFGTIHVPDARVQALPPVVSAAFASSTRLVTEIPLDLDAQLAVGQALLLPPDQRLREILGADRFARLTAVIRTALEDESPVMTAMVVTALDRLKPWAAMTQLALVDYLPDLLSGRPSLDARLYADALEAGKPTSALETVEEQAGVFDVFTPGQQIALLDAALAQVEANTRGDAQPGRVLVERYLAGDAAGLHAAVDEQAPDDPVLARTFARVLLDDRNTRMAERFEALRSAHPDDVMFVAIGTLHLLGETSVPTLLQTRGYRVTRVISAGN